MSSNECLVSVIGLGPMGFRIAELLVKAGFQTTVWNRTLEKAAPLTKIGATAASSSNDAIAAAPMIITVLATAEALKTLLETADLAGKTIVNLGSASQHETAMLSDFVQGAGGDYISGSIYANPSNLATPDSAIIYAGHSSLSSLGSTLAILSPAVMFVGNDPAQTKLLSMSICTQMYVSIIGFLEGASLASTANISAESYADFVRAILAPFYGKMITNVGKRIDEGNSAGDESTISTEAHIVDMIKAQFKQAGLKAEGMELFSSYIDRAVESGQQDNGMAALYNVIRQS